MYKTKPQNKQMKKKGAKELFRALSRQISGFQNILVSRVSSRTSLETLSQTDKLKGGVGAKEMVQWLGVPSAPLGN